MNTIRHLQSYRTRTSALLLIGTALVTTGCQTVDFEPCRQTILDARDTGNFCPAIGCACEQYLTQGFVFDDCYYHIHPQTGELTRDCECSLSDDGPSLSTDGSSRIQQRLDEIIRQELGADDSACNLWRDYCESFRAGFDGTCVTRTDPETGDTREDCTCALLGDDDDDEEGGSGPVLTPIGGRAEAELIGN